MPIHKERRKGEFPVNFGSCFYILRCRPLAAMLHILDSLFIKNIVNRKVNTDDKTVLVLYVQSGMK